MRSRIPHIAHQHLPRLSPTAGWTPVDTLGYGRSVPADYPVGTRFVSPGGLVVELVQHGQEVRSSKGSGKTYKRKVCTLLELGCWTRGVFKEFDQGKTYDIYSTYGRGPNDGGGDLGGWQAWRPA